VGQALPAVTLPRSRKMGGSAASLASVVSGRNASSAATAAPPCPAGGNGTISSANTPRSLAAATRWWLLSAQASWSARGTWQAVATSSAVSPMLR